jgi:hypothetical protein
MTKISVVSRDVEAMVAEAADPARRVEMFVSFAREAFGEVDAQNRAAAGREIPSTHAVDGVAGAPLASAKVGSTIAWEWQLGIGIVAETLALLISGAPKRSGRFSKSFLVFADGVETAPEAIPPETIEVVITNTQPYARKIERGKVGGKPAFFQGVAAVARSRFGNGAQVKFTFTSLADRGSSSVVEWARTTKMKVGRRAGGRRTEWLTRQPAISIRFGR